LSINYIVKKIVFTFSGIFLTLFFTVQIYSQGLTSQQLDSLYTKFIQLRVPELLPQTDQPAELTLEDRKCGFSIVNSVKSNIDRFSSEQQSILKSFLSRPVLQNSVVSPSGFFRIHYDASGINRPSYVSTWSVEQNVAELANALDSVYRFEVTYLGFLPPPGDNSGGGDDKYDVYIQNQGGGVYGYTEWESKISSISWSSFMVIDNDYVGYYSTGLNGMKVTVAHEFHHGIQLGNYSVSNGNSPYREADVFFYEITSTSMEEFVYDDVNDYYAYMHSYFNNTDTAFPRQNGYNIAIWNIYIIDNFGFGILKRQWELIPSIAAILSINQSLNEANTSFPRELNKFGIWTFFTSYRRIPGKYFEEADSYPIITPTFTIPFPSPPPGNLEAEPTSNNYLLFNISSRSDSLVAVITNGDAFAASNDPYQRFPYDYILYADSSVGSRKLSENYSSDFSALDMSYWSVSEILNNILVRQDTSQNPIVESEEIFAFPNPCYYSKIPSRGIFIAFATKVGEEVDFNVYSIGMQLVHSSAIRTNQTITEDFKTYTGINWDGLDNDKNKLASGVYIFVIKQGDEVVKGKVVIFNE
jgi:hypothetical protein